MDLKRDDLEKKKFWINWFVSWYLHTRWMVWSGKKYNSITMIDKILDIFFWNPFFSHRIPELLFVFRINITSCACKITVQKAELWPPGTHGYSWIFRTMNGTCHLDVHLYNLRLSNGCHNTDICFLSLELSPVQLGEQDTIPLSIRSWMTKTCQDLHESGPQFVLIWNLLASHTLLV